jgi:hypothetical protein
MGAVAPSQFTRQTGARSAILGRSESNWVSVPNQRRPGIRMPVCLAGFSVGGTRLGDQLEPTRFVDLPGT